VSREPLPTSEPIRVKVTKPGDPYDGHVGDWIGSSSVPIGPLKNRVFVLFGDGAIRAYLESELTWMRDDR
jgi:hypothetical protein